MHDGADLSGLYGGHECNLRTLTLAMSEVIQNRATHHAGGSGAVADPSQSLVARTRGLLASRVGRIRLLQVAGQALALIFRITPVAIPAAPTAMAAIPPMRNPEPGVPVAGAGWVRSGGGALAGAGAMASVLNECHCQCRLLWSVLWAHCGKNSPIKDRCWQGVRA